MRCRNRQRTGGHGAAGDRKPTILSAVSRSQRRTSKIIHPEDVGAARMMLASTVQAVAA
jgi:hypothetical protein